MKADFSVSDFLYRAEQVHGDRIGIYDEPEAPGGGLGSLTYKRVAELARAQAAGLDALGIEAGERVAVVSQNSARLLVSFFGVSGFGRILVPVNFRLSPNEVEYIVEHSGATVLLVDPELADSLSFIDVKHRFIFGHDTDQEIFLEGVEPRSVEANEDSTATINYTSGTTARPKGVEMTHRNLWVNATTFGWHAGVSMRDVYLHTLPMFHCNGWGMPFATAGMGVPQVVLRKVDGPEILRRVQKHGVTLLCGAPAVVAAVLDAAAEWDGPIPGAGVTRIIVAGAPPPTRTIERVETELGWEFIQIYGLTETSPFLTMNRSRQEYDDLSPSDRAAKLARAGAPAIGIRLKTGSDGEVLARGNVVLEGYWNQPTESVQALEGGWFHTGDGGNIDDEGHLSIVDRKKDVIISGGENVSSIEVEDVVFSHPAVTEVAVIGVPDEKWGESVKALVVLGAGQQVSEQELIDYCRDRLAHYKCPKSVEFRDVLDRTATGKLQKFKLREPYWQGHDRQVN